MKVKTAAVIDKKSSGIDRRCGETTHGGSKSPLIKNKSGVFKIGFFSSLFYISSGGACPCCGASLASCPVTLTIAGIFGVFSMLFFSVTGRVAQLKNRLTTIFRKT